MADITYFCIYKDKSALILAAEKGYAEMCSLLVDSGADVNLTDEVSELASVHFLSNVAIIL
jgi:hypothetical protein